MAYFLKINLMAVFTFQTKIVNDYLKFVLNEGYSIFVYLQSYGVQISVAEFLILNI